MSKTICQTVVFKNSTPDALYAIYMDAKKHSKAIGGGKVSISAKIGSSYSAWDGYISGKTLCLVKGEMIVQTWRAADFNSSDPDSILVLRFDKRGNETVVNMVHALVPDHKYHGIKSGWDDFYWKPWRKYLLGR